LAHSRSQERPATGEHVHFAGKLTGTMHRDQLFVSPGRANNFDLARNDDEEG